MDETQLTEEELQTKHRKERKDLQAKIVAIKKTADKKKKRETNEMIAKLEAELKQQQDAELNELSERFTALICQIGEKIPEEVTPARECASVPQVNHSQKTSRAQRRRDKKSEQEKATRERIAVEETLAEDNKRALETKTISTILDQMDFHLHEIPSDGDCLYNALIHQLTVTGQCLVGLDDLRKRTADYLRAHKTEFIPFMTNDRDDLMSDNEFETYCTDVASTKAWGGQVELKALAEILQSCIQVIQADSPMVEFGEKYRDYPPLVITYHRFMYSLGEHYNSTVRLEA